MYPLWLSFFSCTRGIPKLARTQEIAWCGRISKDRGRAEHIHLLLWGPRFARRADGNIINYGWRVDQSPAPLNSRRNTHTLEAVRSSDSSAEEEEVRIRTDHRHNKAAAGEAEPAGLQRPGLQKATSR